MRADVKFYVDWDNDGDYGDAGEDVTADVIAAVWSLGMQQAWQTMADEPELTLTLNNDLKAYSPEFASAALFGDLLPQRRVKVEVEAPVLDEDDNPVVDEGGNYVTATLPLWTGWTGAIRPTPMRNGGPFRTTIDCTGPKWLLEGAEVTLPLLEDTTADAVIAAILARSAFSPASSAAWLLGIPGASELGESTYLADTTLPYDLEAGVLAIPYAGDNWDDLASAYEGIASAATAERGRFFFDREGKAVFWNRQHLQLADDLDATLDDDVMTSLDYAYGDDIVNDVKAVAYPRALSSDPEVLWELDEDLTLKGREVREFRMRWASADGQQVAALSVTTPNYADGSLAMAPGQPTPSGDNAIQVNAFEADARGATITLENRSKRDATLRTMRTLGTKVTSWNSQEIREVDAESVSRYGRRQKTFDLKLMSSLSDAERLAEWELLHRADPAGRARSVGMLNFTPARLSLQLGLTMGSRVRVQETQTAHDREYFVIGERYEWRDAGTFFSSTHYLEPAPAYDGWLLGVTDRGELGMNTYLGF